MNEIKFACPECQQRIQSDAGYAGTQITCPACKSPMIVPGTPPAPAPAPGKCPSCGTQLARGLFRCTKCGFKLVG